MRPSERLPPVLEAQLALVKEALVTIGGGTSGELELRNLRAFLVNILDLVTPSDQVNGAVDDLYEAALGVQRAHAGLSMKGLLIKAKAADRALDALRAALRTAKPGPVSGTTLW